MTMLHGFTMGFPLVYFWVSQLGGWKLHPYNSIALMGGIYNHPNFAHSACFGRISEFLDHENNDSVGKQP